MFESKAEVFEPRLGRLAALARALGHPARLAILEILARRDACICGDLVDELPLAQASVSRHLKALKQAGLIRGAIDGPRSCYCLDPEALVSLEAALDDFFDGVRATPLRDTCC